MKSEEIGRRGFIAAAGATAFSILKPQAVRGMQANSAVRVGLLGCGGRGTTHLETILKNTDARITVLADLFEDRLDKAKQHVNELSAANGHPGVERTFVGPEAYRQIVESKDIDAVVIATPPYFHVQHLEAAVDAGKHVYCEKPVAIDVPGAKRVLEIGKKAEGKLSLDVGFQIRMAPPFVELVNRIHAAPRIIIVHAWISIIRTRRSRRGGCAIGFRIACFPETSSWSRTSTPSTFAIGYYRVIQ